jgi:adenylate kinase
MSTYVVFFGPPGCGKGTQAKKVEAEFGLTHISTGDLFRSHLCDKTALGLQAQEYISRGELVPDDITIGMVRERLLEPDAQNKVVFDGFPRTGDQAQALDNLLKEFNSKLAMVVEFTLPIEVSRARLLGRSEGRTDDKPEVIEKRLRDHASVEASVMPHYRSQDGLIKQVDAQGSIDEVYETVRELIQSVLD